MWVLQESILLADWRLSVASRYLRAGVGDKLTSFTSMISGLGLVLAVAILTIVLSVMNGFEKELRERVLGVLPHGIVSLPDGDLEALGKELLSHGSVIAIAPLLEGSGLLLANGRMAGILVSGVDPDRESQVSILDEFFIQGSMHDLTSQRFSLAIGKRLAEDLNVAIGDSVNFVSPEVQMSLVGPLPTSRRFTIAAIFAAGADVDKTQVYTSIEALSRLQKGRGSVGFRLLMSDLFDAPEIVRQLIVTSKQRIYGSSWTQRYGNLHGAIHMQKKTMFLMLMLLVAVAAFNVVSNLMMVVKEKAGDIAIIRTMGASTNAVRIIFITHGVLVGAVGVTIGLVLGTGLALIIDDVVLTMDGVLKLGLMDEYFIQYLPVDIRLEDILLIAVSSLAICFIATIYPAGKAAKANPVEALQYES